MKLYLRYHHGHSGVVEVLVHLNHLQGLHDPAKEDVVELDTAPVSKRLLVLQGQGNLDTRLILAEMESVCRSKSNLGMNAVQV